MTGVRVNSLREGNPKDLTLCSKRRVADKNSRDLDTLRQFAK